MGPRFWILPLSRKQKRSLLYRIPSLSPLKRQDRDKRTTRHTIPCIASLTGLSNPVLLTIICLAHQEWALNRFKRWRCSTWSTGYKCSSSLLTGLITSSRPASKTLYSNWISAEGSKRSFPIFQARRPIYTEWLNFYNYIKFIKWEMPLVTTAPIVLACPNKNWNIPRIIHLTNRVALHLIMLKY